MPGIAKATRATIIPALRHRDASAAIDWLCRAFGFEPHLVVPGEDGTIAHAQLVFGNGMIMLGSARDDDFGRLIRPPEGGVGTQSRYVVVADADPHYARAKEAGAATRKCPCLRLLRHFVYDAFVDVTIHILDDLARRLGIASEVAFSKCWRSRNTSSAI
jgi:uncharacterized glyoxalase superfamily protein PhnB